MGLPHRVRVVPHATRSAWPVAQHWARHCWRAPRHPGRLLRRSSRSSWRRWSSGSGPSTASRRSREWRGRAAGLHTWGLLAQQQPLCMLVKAEGAGMQASESPVGKGMHAVQACEAAHCMPRCPPLFSLRVPSLRCPPPPGARCAFFTLAHSVLPRPLPAPALPCPAGGRSGLRCRWTMCLGWAALTWRRSSRR